MVTLNLPPSLRFREFYCLGAPTHCRCFRPSAQSQSQFRRPASRGASSKDQLEVSLTQRLPTAMPSSPPSGSPCAASRCQVPGCKADLSLLRNYYSRYKICELHVKVPEVQLSGELCRFCQLCGRFHALSAFDDSRRSCRARLAKHNARRKQMMERKAAEGSYCAAGSTGVGSQKKKASRQQRKPSMAAAADPDSSFSEEDACDTSCHEEEATLIQNVLLQAQHQHDALLPAIAAAAWQQDANMDLLAGASCAPHLAAAATLGPHQMFSAPLPWALASAQPPQVPFAWGVQPINACQQPRFQHCGSDLSEHSASSPLDHASPASTCSDPSTSGGEALDIDAGRELKGLATLWQEWSSDSSSFVEPSALASLATASGYKQQPVRALGADQSLDALWRSIQVEVRVAPLPQLASELCWAA